MAKLEYEMGISSTYYFRYNKSTFLPDIIKKISDYGHEVGYHYETLGKSNGNVAEAIDLFYEELSEYNKITKIKTISMHGRPLSRYDNEKLFDYLIPFKMGIIGDAIRSIMDNEICYFTDAGRTWDNSNNIRDSYKLNNCSIGGFNDLLDALKKRSMKKVYINVHPERWCNEYNLWIIMLVFDTLANLTKKLAHRFDLNINIEI